MTVLNSLVCTSGRLYLFGHKISVPRINVATCMHEIQQLRFAANILFEMYLSYMQIILHRKSAPLTCLLLLKGRHACTLNHVLQNSWHSGVRNCTTGKSSFTKLQALLIVTIALELMHGAAALHRTVLLASLKSRIMQDICSHLTPNFCCCKNKGSSLWFYLY